MGKYKTKCPGCSTEYYVEEESMYEVCQCPNCGRDFIPADNSPVRGAAQNGEAGGGWVGTLCRVLGYIMPLIVLPPAIAAFEAEKSALGMGLILSGLILALPLLAVASHLELMAKTVANTSRICQLLTQVAAKLKKAEKQDQGNNSNIA